MVGMNRTRRGLRQRNRGVIGVVAALLVALVGTVTLAPTHVAQAATTPTLIASPTAALTTGATPPTSAIYVAMNGSDSNTGTQAKPFRTLAKALTVVKKGGSVVLRDGIYREGASGTATGGTRYYTNIPANVTIQAYPGEIVWFDGAQRVTSWTTESSSRYSTSWQASDLCAGSYYSRSPLDASTNGPCAYADAATANPVSADPLMVYADGKELTQVDSLSKLTSTTFYHDWAKRKVYVGANPTTSRIEITKYAQAMAFYNPQNLTIRGIGFRHYASNQYDNATGAALLINQGDGVLLDKVVIRENAGAGLLVWGSEGLTIRSSMVYKNGANGINVAGSAKKSGVRDDLTVEYSRITSNNLSGFGTSCTSACASAGMKASGLVGATIRFNTFSDNEGGRASGLWCDLDCQDVDIYGNIASGNARHGILYEVSSTGSIFSNLISDNAWDSTQSGGGWGLMVSAAQTRIYNNTVVDNRQGVYLYDDDRSPQSSTGYDASRVGPNSTGIEFVNNIVSASSSSSTAQLRVQGGKASVAGNTAAPQVVSALDSNSFSLPSGVRFVQWTNRTGESTKIFQTIAELQSGIGKKYMASGQLVRSSKNAFVSADSRHTTLGSSSGLTAGVALPSDMASALGTSQQKVRGAIVVVK